MTAFNFAWITALAAAGLIAAAPAPAGAQPAASPMQRGVLIAAAGRCLGDALTADQRQAATVLGALAPDVASRIAPPPDELAVLAQACSLQLHQQRCGAKILAVAGGLLTAQHPAGRAMPPAVNPGAIVGGTAGLISGVLFGASSRRVGAVIGGAVGMYGGAQAGSAWYERAMAGSCMVAQRQLDAVSRRLVGQVGQFSAAGVLALLDQNLRRGTISADEAARLRVEVERLHGVTDALLDAMR